MTESKSATKDPICGMTVDELTALKAERDGKTFYFCGDRCRQAFLSDPTGAVEGASIQWPLPNSLRQEAGAMSVFRTVDSLEPESRSLSEEDFQAIRALMRATDCLLECSEKTALDPKGEAIAENVKADAALWEDFLFNRREQCVLIINAYVSGRAVGRASGS